MDTEVLIVGAGFAGCVVARQLAEAGRQVVVLDRRPHLGGNAYDEFDRNGVFVHKYGPHIFHTNSEQAFTYLSRFTKWNQYRHRVQALIDGVLLPFPINIKTVSKIFSVEEDRAAVKEFFKQKRIRVEKVKTAEDLVWAMVGKELGDLFYRGYSRKQWGLELSELSPNVVGRVRPRLSFNDDYFLDEFQGIPDQGYTKMFERMLAHSNVSLLLGTDYFSIREDMRFRHLVFTGPIDEFFGFSLGHLPYRSLRFEHVHLSDIGWYQPCGTVNYPNEEEFTRITEFKHFTGQEHSGTSIVKEYPMGDGEPYYPMETIKGQSLFAEYSRLASLNTDVTFLGRLGEYKYFNMDQVVISALEAAKTISNVLRG